MKGVGLGVAGMLGATGAVFVGYGPIPAVAAFCAMLFVLGVTTMAVTSMRAAPPSKEERML